LFVLTIRVILSREALKRRGHSVGVHRDSIFSSFYHLIGKKSVDSFFSNTNLATTSERRGI
ncbi:unnamed protein product, partial [Hymenolepis diminuta]